MTEPKRNTGMGMTDGEELRSSTKDITIGIKSIVFLLKPVKDMP